MRLEQRAAGSICLLLLLVAVAACAPPEEPRAEGPGGIVQDFYDRLNSGAYEEAKAMYSSDALAILDDPSSTDDMFAGWARHETKQGSIDRVRVLSSELDEGTAEIQVEILYGDGSTATKSVTLVEEAGEWKLNLVA